jgi:hypothetical protein
MEELYGVIEEILQDDGKVATKTIITGYWKVWLEIHRIETLLDHLDWQEEVRQFKCLQTFVKELIMLSMT